MIASFPWKPDKLFFFDKDKKIRWQKRKKRSLDSLPITLLRQTTGFQKEKFDKGRKVSVNAKEGQYEGDNLGEIFEEFDDKRPLRKSEVRFANDLDFSFLDDEEDTQRFLYEEAKFSAPGLLAQIEKYLIYLMKYRSNERAEIAQLNQEVEAIYGNQWGKNVFENKLTLIQIPDDLYTKLCYDYEQFAAGTAYVERKWQTTVYRELAALQELKGNHNSFEFVSPVGSSPDVAGFLRGSSYDKQRQSADEKERRSEKMSFAATVGEEKNVIFESDANGPPIIGIQRESSRVQNSLPKPKTRADKFDFSLEKDKGENEKRKNGHTKISFGPHESFEDEITSIKNWEANFEKNILSANQNFLPGSVINFSMTSKMCHDKGWINQKTASEDLEQQNVLKVITTRLRIVMKQREKEDARATLRNENGPLVKRNYGDSKRDNAVKYKKGVAWAKFLSQKKTTASKRFLTTLPDGSACSEAVLDLNLHICPLNTPYATTEINTDSKNSKIERNWEICRFLVTSKEAIFYDENGVLVKKWKWAHGKMMTAETFQLNDSISLRCVSQNSIFLTVHAEGESAKFPISPFLDSTEPDLDNLGYLMTSEVFLSRSAILSLQPRRKLTREEKRARNQKKDPAKSGYTGLSEESLAERIKDLNEKFPERKDIDVDAPFLLELHKLQRKVRNVVFEWMEHYRLSVGISRPSKISMLQKKKQRMNSANSLPEAMPSSPRRKTSPTPRAPSAPPIPASLRSRLKMSKIVTGKEQILMEYALDKQPSMIDFSSQAEYTDTRIDVPQLPKTSDAARAPLSTSPLPRKAQTSESPRTKTPRPLLLPKEGCPIALRLEILGDKHPQCRCDKRRIPIISDLEYDNFIGEHVPKTQLIVVSIISSRFPRTQCDEMLDDVYYDKSKAQNLPCVQSRYDAYRLLRYDLATASDCNEAPLLLRRHNVAPGMFLMYVGGRLLFADYIFNGYGNAKRDFLKQVFQTRKTSMKGGDLAQDFRFTTRPAGRIPRTAWGGEVLMPSSDHYFSHLSKLDIGGTNKIEELPALSHMSSDTEFSIRNVERRKKQANRGIMSYSILSDMQC